VAVGQRRGRAEGEGVGEQVLAKGADRVAGYAKFGPQGGLGGVWLVSVTLSQ
jgi:hypothetical protein